MLALLVAVAVAVQTAIPVQPGRDKALLHRHTEELVAEKQAEQEGALRKLLALGGSQIEQAEVTARLASALRAQGLALAIRAQAEQDAGNAEQVKKDSARSTLARTEAIARYRELLKKYPTAPKLDEALFFLADTLQDSGMDDQAVQSARELVRRFPKSKWAPASHVFIGEHLFEESKLAEALAEYRAAAAVPTDEIYPYALYKAAWCRFNQSGFADAMKLLHQVVAVSLGGDATQPLTGPDQDKVQLAREARRDYVLVYSRVGKPEAARQEFRQQFGSESGRKMLELYGKLLFDTGRDQEAQIIHRQLLEIHGDEPAAALDQTRLLVIAARGGKRRELLHEAQLLVETFRRVESHAAATTEQKEALDEAKRLGEETLRTLSVQTHNEAKKTELDDTWAAAKALYADYLALFPDAAEAYELRYFDGELLYGLGEKSAAAALYEAVVRQDLAAQKARQKQGRWLSQSAWSAVLSRDQATQASEAPARSRKSGRGETQKPAVATSAQRPLTEQEKLLANACSLYLEALPGGQHAVEVAFKLGRLEYLANDLDAAEKQLAWVAQVHPENELAEYAANLVLDISNLRHDWVSVHAWALKFLADKKLISHGTLAADLKRIEGQSAYALADNQAPDAAKAKALLGFAAEHPHGELADKALFGAAAALSRAGRIDDALAARARLWKEEQGSALVPRALLASAADHAALGDFGEAAQLLEKYAGGFRKQEETPSWRRHHPQPQTKTPKPAGPVFEEAKAQSGLHDAAVLREARGELRQALADRTLSLQLWKSSPERDADQAALALLQARAGEPTRAARNLAEVARRAHAKPALQLTAWHDAARLFTRVHETDHATWAFAELEKEYQALGSQAREKLPPEIIAAVAEAHLALGAKAFDKFKQQRIEAPLMRTLNRKIALLQIVKKRDEETVAMRQAEPAVCALSQLGEAQMLLAQGIATSPIPKSLNAEQRKLYRDAINEKAQPLFVEAKETLQGAAGRARELGVTSTCASKTIALLEKMGVKNTARPRLAPLPSPLAPQPGYIDADGKAVGSGPDLEHDDGQATISKVGVAQVEESR